MDQTIEFSEQQPKVIKCNNFLQQKIGTGMINARILEKIQEHLDNVEVDFEEISSPYLQKLEALLNKMPQTDYGREEHIEDIVKPIMELKAVGGVFNEPVVSNLSGMVLGFIETIRKLDDDMLAIVRVHNNAVRMILKHELKKVDDPRAVSLFREVKQACMRYYAKHKDSLD